MWLLMLRYVITIPRCIPDATRAKRKTNPQIDGTSMVQRFFFFFIKLKDIYLSDHVPLKWDIFITLWCVLTSSNVIYSINDKEKCRVSNEFYCKMCLNIMQMVMIMLYDFQMKVWWGLCGGLVTIWRRIVACQAVISQTLYFFTWKQQVFRLILPLT